MSSYDIFHLSIAKFTDGVRCLLFCIVVTLHENKIHWLRSRAYD